MTAAAARMTKKRYWATATIRLFMTTKAGTCFWENRMNTPRRLLGPYTVSSWFLDNWRTFGPSAIAFGEPRPAHGLRHTAASLAIAAAEGPNKSLTAVIYVGPAGLEPTTTAV